LPFSIQGIVLLLTLCLVGESFAAFPTYAFSKPSSLAGTVRNHFEIQTLQETSLCFRAFVVHHPLMGRMVRWLADDFKKPGPWDSIVRKVRRGRENGEIVRLVGPEALFGWILMKDNDPGGAGDP